MKKVLAMILSLVMVFTIIPVAVVNVSAYTSGYYTYTVSKGKATITECNSSIGGDVEIPSELGGYPVTSIGGYAFSDCTSLTSITIPDGVTSIGGYTFSNCTSLTSITIPDSVTSIGDDAFGGCTSLTSISIPDSVTSIGSHAFDDCESLTSITMGNSVTSIGYDAFYNCTSLTEVNINDIASWCNIKFSSYYSNPLYYAKKLYLNGIKITNLNIPKGVTSIGSSAFSGCTSLTSITIPDSVTSIGSGAFSDCTSLTSITIPNSVKNIDDYAFENCIKLKSIKLGNKVKTIGEEAFSDCTSLTSITIPNSVKSIGKYAFDDCKLLTSVTISESIESIDYRAFENCNIQKVIISKGSKKITSKMIFCKDTLVSIIIPNSVKRIDENVFSDCYKLKNVYIDDVNAWCNITFNDYESNPLIYARNLYLNGKLISNLKISNTVKKINNYAFYNIKSLKSVTIADSVTSIGYGAFENCKSLSSIKLGNGIKNIGGDVFYGCKSLTSITIPSSVTSIGYCAFDGCSSLKSVYINDLKSWCNIDFKGNSSNPVWCSKTLYLNGIKTTNLVIPNGTKKISNYAFNNLTSLKSITIPNSVKTIGKSAFYNCNKVKSLYIPKSVESIGSYALNSTSSLTNIYYGDSQRKWYDQVYKTSDDDLKYVNIHFNAKLVTKNAKKATYFANGYSGDGYINGKLKFKGFSIPKLKLSTPKFSVTAGKKLFKVKYNKVKGAIGFQLRYKLNGKWIVKNYNTKKTATKTIKKLKKGKKYTVQIRAFVKSGKKTAYSSWTKTKKVKTK